MEAWIYFSTGFRPVKDVREELNWLLGTVESTCVREVLEELRVFLVECVESRGMLGRIDDVSDRDVFEE